MITMMTKPHRSITTTTTTATTSTFWFVSKFWFHLYRIWACCCCCCCSPLVMGRQDYDNDSTNTDHRTPPPPPPPPPFSACHHRVIIVGAGAAGLYAGHTLANAFADDAASTDSNNDMGTDFVILEARSDFGGRIQHLTDFIDLPMDLGPEWVWYDRNTIASLIKGENAAPAAERVRNDIMDYTPQTLYDFHNGERRQLDEDSHARYWVNWKWKDTTWYQFFETYIYPRVADSIVYNAAVNKIDYASSNNGGGGVIAVETQDGRVYHGSHVLVATPVSALQRQTIEFVPSLPPYKLNVIDQVWMSPGLKVLMEFSERFFPDVQLPFSDDAMYRVNKEYFDATWGKPTDRHVLTLFFVDRQAEDELLLNDNTDEEILNLVLAELDRIFDGQASRYFLQAKVKNWSQEPFIWGAYSLNWGYSMRNLFRPVAGRVFFAGEYMAGEDQATVYGAARTGEAAARGIVQVIADNPVVRTCAPTSFPINVSTFLPTDFPMFSPDSISASAQTLSPTSLMSEALAPSTSTLLIVAQIVFQIYFLGC